MAAGMNTGDVLPERQSLLPDINDPPIGLAATPSLDCGLPCETLASLPLEHIFLRRIS